jgi:hypothetical protein
MYSSDIIRVIIVLLLKGKNNKLNDYCEKIKRDGILQYRIKGIPTITTNKG